MLELLLPGEAELFPVVGLAAWLLGVTLLLALFPGGRAPGVVCCDDEGDPASARRMEGVRPVESGFVLLA